MTPEDFDALLRESDPGSPEDVTEQQNDWKRLVARRATTRRRMVVFATAAAILIATGLAWIATNDGGDARIADREEQPVKTQTNRPPELEAPTNRSDGAGESSRDTPEAPEPKEPEPLETLAMLVAKAISGEKAWASTVQEIREADASIQREIIDLVPQLDDILLRDSAIELVCEAADRSERDVLGVWLNKPSTRPTAWGKLVDTSDFRQAVSLTDWARDDRERGMLCRKLVSSGHPQSLDVIAQLALQPQWRTTIRRDVKRLSPAQVRVLTLRMRSQDRNVKMASAFILASLRDDTVERVAASMILGGRYRHPAYLVLLSRNTPQSNAFLMSAGARQDLSPALVSARFHYSAFEDHLKQWLLDSDGEFNEPQTKQDRGRGSSVVRHDRGTDRVS
ncbi:MAG: hypothetical protein AAFX06_25395 [Planctomycetota bacterium]